MKSLKMIGEKELIKKFIKPLFNPSNAQNSVGDDCAVIGIDNKSICISTDRVPADLISYKIGLINDYQLGNYLAVLNISDLASSGAEPVGLLLTLAFEDDHNIDSFKDILNGVNDCAKRFGCEVLGGDLSNSKEMSLAATSIGITYSSSVLYRSNIQEGDLLFCSDFIGITPTAFEYFLYLKPKGFFLSKAEESLLADQFRNPQPRISLGRMLSKSSLCTACMDNTDGFSQTFFELSEINNYKFEFDFSKLPIHELSYKIAEKLDMDITDLIFSAGADFQLMGALTKDYESKDRRKIITEDIYTIGKVKRGSGLKLCKKNGNQIDILPKGWNYYQNKD